MATVEDQIDRSTESLPRLSRRRFVAIGAAAGTSVAAVARLPAIGSGDAEAVAPAPTNAHAVEPPSDLGRRSVYWSVPTAGPLVALTFDDGPDPDFTPAVLAALDAAGVPATFFMMGHNVEAHSALARAVVDAGHEVGNHTWTHLDLEDQTPASTAEQLELGTAAIRRVTGVEPRWFRPPRGNLTGAALQTVARLGQDIVLWSATPGKAADGGPAAVVTHLLDEVTPGGIIGLHDGVGRGTFNPGRAFTATLRRRRQVEIEALPEVLRALTARGLRFVTTSELVDAGAASTAAPATLR